MATLHNKLMESITYKDGSHPVKLVLTHRRKRKRFVTGVRTIPDHWNEDLELLTKKASKFKKHNETLQKMKFRAQEILDHFKVTGKTFTLALFEQEFLGPKNQKVYPYYQEVIERLFKKGSVGNARAYKDSRNTLQKFHPDEELTFVEIDVRFLKRFEDHLYERDLKETTICKHMRTLRAVYNRAMEDKVARKELYPFDDFKVSKYNMQTRKRALNMKQLQQIKKFQPEQGTKQQLSKDMFLFSFYMQGMDFVDLAQLKWSDIADDRIVYERQKTGKLLSIKIQPPASEILSRYRSMTGHKIYIFPVLDESYEGEKEIRSRINSGRKRLNMHLKEIGHEMDLDFPLTSKVSRHTYATALKRAGQPIGLIQDAMAHSSQKTTGIYLDSLGNEAIDRANEEIFQFNE